MEEIIKQLRKEFNRIGDNRQESNIRLHIIENTFMNYYGYDLSKCIEEKSVPKGMCDVFIPTIRNEALIIEVKNGKKPIDVMDELLQRRSNKINWKPLFDGLLCESK